MTKAISGDLLTIWNVKRANLAEVISSILFWNPHNSVSVHSILILSRSNEYWKNSVYFLSLLSIQKIKAEVVKISTVDKHKFNNVRFLRFLQKSSKTGQFTINNDEICL